MNKYAATMSLLSTAIGAVGTLGGALGIAWYVSRRVNPVPRRRYIDAYTFTPWELGVPYEQITLQTSDGLNLRCWWLPRPDSQTVIIGCHGHTGAKHDLLGIGTSLWRVGHNVLLFDMRGRGESDPAPNTLAGHEVEDVLTAVGYVRERMPEARIGLIGFSMGAVTALLAAVREPAIAAVVADSPFASAADVVALQMRRTLPLAVEPLLAMTDALVARWYGYHLSRVRPIDVIGQLAPRPLLLIHATNDTLIPVEHAHQLFAAADEPKELWICDDAEHCGTYFSDRNVYVERVDGFFKQYLGSIEP